MQIETENKTLSRIILLGFFLLLFLCSCNKPTNNPQANVVKLRANLIDLARSNISEIEGNTSIGESYILMYGYSEPSALKDLPISDKLKIKLEKIYPPKDYEEYVLAHTYKDDILEHTEWVCQEEDYHPYISPLPFIISGNPYKLEAKKLEGEAIKLVIYNAIIK